MMSNPIMDEAIAWFVRTHSDQRTLTDEDRFTHWLKQDVRHAQAYARVENVWRAAGPPIAPRVLPAEPRQRRWVAISGLAATVAVAVVGAAIFFHPSARITAGTFATVTGAQRQLTLADGSTITLNTRSEVIVDLTAQRRLVRLMRGEARFQVAKEASRPFVVDAGIAQVRALGTAFDVRVTSERVAVTLVEGRVEVTPTRLTPASEMPVLQPAILRAGQQLSLDLESGAGSIKAIDPERASAWLRQQLIFDAVRLTEAVEEANRYLDVSIVIDDPSLAELRISGVVRAGNLESFVGALEASFPIEARKRKEGQVDLVRR